ncbi:MAG: sodium:proton antiporter [Planctomycetales bacterium]|nr:sodium:proton antiporter [Planctomycetales bacterium]
MEHSSHHAPASDKPLIAVIGLLVVAYVLASVAGWTQSPAATASAEQHLAEGSDHGSAAEADVLDDPAPAEDTHSDAAPSDAAPSDNGHGGAPTVPPYASVLPFLALLGAIAILPLVKQTMHWWESNLHRFYVAAGLALITLAYYFFVHAGDGMHNVMHVLDHAILGEYVPFIVLLFSLYTISGGVRISGDLVARPLTNTVFITIGGLLASFIGTTGAAMLLIRPLLNTNDERKHVQHTVVFFIFVVCNCGGCLLPIGDPPLFLGYLLGVEFFWTMWNLWWPWLLANGLIILTYYVMDRMVYYPRETALDVSKDVAEVRPVKISGLWPNALLMLGVIASVAFLDPTKPLPGTQWYPYVYLREMVQLALVGLSLLLGSKDIRTANKFNYHAIIEVAALFVGIFICMQPALAILDVKGAQLGLDSPMKFFWATGGLSAVLDNAPTYVVFFQTAAANPEFHALGFTSLVSQTGEVAESARSQLTAISLGAVFLGAMTYIGNGPNFMVRAIAEQSNVRMPSFFGYVFRYSLPILVPIFLVVAWLVL